MSEWSEYVDERRVRHLWECEECDYAFETIVSYEAAAGFVHLIGTGAPT